MSEVNFDGLVGLTHNYAGLSFGNVASTSHRNTISNPKEAALQGLRKMKSLYDLGVPQAVLPPQERPSIGTLRQLGFTGSDAEILSKVAKSQPALLTAVSSASSMWTANAATVSPSADAADGKVHFTPANLSNKFHRSIEPPTTARVLAKIFSDDKHFVHHPALPPGNFFSDEGAANHTRLCGDHDRRGVELFVYGREAFRVGPEPKKFPARQTLEASQVVVRSHGLSSDAVVFAQQHPDVIDAGVFHNDVISVGSRNLLLVHEKAYLDSDRVVGELKEKFRKQTGGELNVVEVKTSEVSIDEAVRSYLFNTQIVTNGKNETAIIAPNECQEISGVRNFLERLVANKSVAKVHYLDLRQSMQNGGGPACLRLRVVLTPAERKAIKANVFIDDKLYSDLTHWVEKHYRDRLVAEDLADPKLLDENRRALEELTQLLGIGAVYPFQG